MPLPRFQFSLRTLLGFVTLWAVVLAAGRCFGGFYWIVSVTRVAVFPALLVLVVLRLRVPGYKLDGVVSVASMICYHAAIFCWEALEPIPESVAVTFFVCFLCAVYVTWILFALIAIRTRRSPNVSIGLLSLVFAISPFSLTLLDELHSLAARLFGFEWYDYRVFHWVLDILWNR